MVKGRLDGQITWQSRSLSMAKVGNYSNSLNLLTQVLGSDRIKYNEKLSYHTFSKRGGPAELFYIATTKRELINVLDNAKQLDIPTFLIGSGTKVLVSEKGIKGLVIKNRTNDIKVGGIKGKVGREGIGIEEALVEVDSGVSLNRLNEFLKSQKLKEINGFSSLKSSIGGALFLDPQLRGLVQKISVWDACEVYDIEIKSLNRNKHIILSTVLKVKAKED